MRKFIAHLIAFFIPFRGLRHRVRAKISGGMEPSIAAEIKLLEKNQKEEWRRLKELIANKCTPACEIQDSPQNISASPTIGDYSTMQKNHYDDIAFTSEAIVGNYAWHENFPYETFLLYKYGDVRFPIFENFKDKKALDFACGPGRMIKRMNLIFNKVDGCDISQRLLDEAKLLSPASDFYLTSGQDLGNTPDNYYDFVYCTISMQHIACHSIRMNIVRNMQKVLKPGGCMTLQLAYNANFPYVAEHAIFINDKKVIIAEKANQADWQQDATFAKTTNAGFDVGIGEKDLQDVKSDFASIFGNSEVWFANVDNYYKDLKGVKHNEYWAKDWIFIHCEKVLG